MLMVGPFTPLGQWGRFRPFLVRPTTGAFARTGYLGRLGCLYGQGIEYTTASRGEAVPY